MPNPKKWISNVRVANYSVLTMQRFLIPECYHKVGCVFLCVMLFPNLKANQTEVLVSAVYCCSIHCVLLHLQPAVRFAGMFVPICHVSPVWVQIEREIYSDNESLLKICVCRHLMTGSVWIMWTHSSELRLDHVCFIVALSSRFVCLCMSVCVAGLSGCWLCSRSFINSLIKKTDTHTE